jgi:hypothetical protein
MEQRRGDCPEEEDGDVGEVIEEFACNGAFLFNCGIFCCEQNHACQLNLSGEFAWWKDRTHLERGCNVRCLEAVSIGCRFTHDTPRLFESSRQIRMHENDLVKNHGLRRSALMEQIGWREWSNILWPTAMEFIHSMLQDSVKFRRKVPSVKPGARVGDGWFGERADSSGCGRVRQVPNARLREHLVVELAGIEDSRL